MPTHKAAKQTGIHTQEPPTLKEGGPAYDSLFAIRQHFINDYDHSLIPWENLWNALETDTPDDNGLNTSFEIDEVCKAHTKERFGLANLAEHCTREEIIEKMGEMLGLEQETQQEQNDQQSIE